MGDWKLVNDLNLFFNRLNQSPTPPPTQSSLLQPTSSASPVYCFLIALVLLVPYSLCFWGTSWSTQGWTTEYHPGFWTTSPTDHSVWGHETVSWTVVCSKEAPQGTILEFMYVVLVRQPSDDCAIPLPHHRWGWQGVQRSDPGLFGLVPVEPPPDEYREDQSAGGGFPQAQSNQEGPALSWDASSTQCRWWDDN